MEQLLDWLVNLIGSKQYGTVTTGIIVVLVILTIYNKIKYQCLEKISNFVAEVEKNTELTGDQKYELVKIWLANEVKITNRPFMNKLVDKLISSVYTNSKLYAINYISRKVNVDTNKVYEALNMIKEQNEKTT